MSAATSDAPPPRRLRAFALTFLSSQVHSFLTLLLGFVTTPLLLHHLGAERLGLWRVLEVWLAYLALLPQTVAQGVAFLLMPLLAAGDGAAGAVAIVAANGAFVRLWVGPGYEPDGRMQVAFAVTYPLLGVNILVTWLLTATGQHRLMLLSTAIYCAATLLAGSVGGRWGGPAGVAWGTTAGIAAAVAVNLIAAQAIYRLAIRALAWRLLATAILAVAFGGAWAELVARVASQGWAGVLAVLAAGWAGFGLLAGAVYLDGGDWAELLRVARAVAGWRTPPRG